MSYFLSANNIGTLISKNLNESISALQSKDIDCVILDMGMPDKVAYQALESIKENKGLENLPIIVFTGRDLSIVEQNKIKKYADSIVVKTAHSYQRILDEAVLMDMMMPEMDGYQTIREIRNNREFKKIPILAVTAKAMRGDREKCIEAGASDYISKPVDIDQLMSLLRVWLYDKI